VRFVLLTTLVVFVGFACMGGDRDEPQVETLIATDITAQGALLRAAYVVAPEGDELIVDGGFTEPDEDGVPPPHWDGPVLLHEEADPEVADLKLRQAYDPPYGDAVAYLRYTSGVPEGWAGVAWQQELAEPVQGPAPLTLSYFIRHQYSTGTGHIDHHGGFVELELEADDETYRLRFLHVRHGELPEDKERIAYVDAGDPAWQTWTHFTHDVPESLSEAFPHLDDYAITVVRIGVLMHKTAGDVSGFYWIFDGMSLVLGEATASVGFAYRAEGAPSWTETGWAPVIGSGVHETPLTGLATGTRYEYRAILRTPDEEIVGDTRGFTPQDEDDQC